MDKINLREWKISYAGLVAWADENDVEIHAYIHHGARGPSAEYGFAHDEDFLAFKLIFEQNNT
jgi:hypothetical protein